MSIVEQFRYRGWLVFRAPDDKGWMALVVDPKQPAATIGEHVLTTSRLGEDGLFMFDGARTKDDTLIDFLGVLEATKAPRVN